MIRKAINFMTDDEDMRPWAMFVKASILAAGTYIWFILLASMGR